VTDPRSLDIEQPLHVPPGALSPPCFSKSPPFTPAQCSRCFFAPVVLCAHTGFRSFHPLPPRIICPLSLFVCFCRMSPCCTDFINGSPRRPISQGGVGPRCNFLLRPSFLFRGLPPLLSLWITPKAAKWFAISPPISAANNHPPCSPPNFPPPPLAVFTRFLQWAAAPPALIVRGRTPFRGVGTLGPVPHFCSLHFCFGGFPPVEGSVFSHIWHPPCLNNVLLRPRLVAPLFALSQCLWD